MTSFRGSSRTNGAGSFVVERVRTERPRTTTTSTVTAEAMDCNGTAAPSSALSKLFLSNVQRPSAAEISRIPAAAPALFPTTSRLTTQGVCRNNHPPALLGRRTSQKQSANNESENRISSASSAYTYVSEYRSNFCKVSATQRAHLQHLQSQVLNPKPSSLLRERNLASPAVARALSGSQTSSVHGSPNNSAFHPIRDDGSRVSAISRIPLRESTLAEERTQNLGSAPVRPGTGARGIPRPYSTKPVRLASLRNPVTTKLDDAPVQVSLPNESSSASKLLFKPTPPHRDSTSSTSDLKERAPMQTPVPSLRPPSRLPTHPRLPPHTSCSTMDEVDIRDNRNEIPLTGQFGPMVLNLENLEDSTMEVLQMELERSDSEDEYEASEVHDFSELHEAPMFNWDPELLRAALVAKEAEMRQQRPASTATSRGSVSVQNRHGPSS